MNKFETSKEYQINNKPSNIVVNLLLDIWVKFTPLACALFMRQTEVV
jgi:hypothetical protein